MRNNKIAKYKTLRKLYVMDALPRNSTGKILKTVLRKQNHWFFIPYWGTPLANGNMERLTKIQLKAPYLIFIGDEERHFYAKTGLGIVQWRPDDNLSKESDLLCVDPLIGGCDAIVNYFNKK